MPYGLFDYVPDNTIHTMGLSPLPDYKAYSGGSTNPYTRAIPEGPTQNLVTDGFIGAESPLSQQPGTQVTTKMAYGEESPGNFQQPTTFTTLAAICGEDPKFCRPVTAAIPEDPTQVIKPPTQQGQCPPGYGGPSPEPPRVAPIEEQIRMPIKSPITLMMGETTSTTSFQDVYPGFMVGSGLSMPSANPIRR